MNTVKAWLIANTEIIYLILQIVITIILWRVFPDTVGEDGELTNHGLLLGLFSLAFTAIFIWSVKSLKAEIILIVGVLILLGLLFFNKELEVPISVKVYGAICVGIAFAFGLFLSAAAYHNFGEVVSRRFLFRNSHVSVFEEQLKYSINRFYIGFITVFSLALEVITTVMIQGEL